LTRIDGSCLFYRATLIEMTTRDWAIQIRNVLGEEGVRVYVSISIIRLNCQHS